MHINTGALSVPMCLAIATGLWVWMLPETKGIELPKLQGQELPTTTSSTADAEQQQKQEKEQER